MNKKLAIISTLAAGIAASIAPSHSPRSGQTQLESGTQLRTASAEAQPVRQAPALRGGSSTAIPYLNLGGGGFVGRGKGSGMSPKEWGMSAACKRMVRHNRMRRAGIGGQRI